MRRVLNAILVHCPLLGLYQLSRAAIAPNLEERNAHVLNARARFGVGFIGAVVLEVRARNGP